MKITCPSCASKYTVSDEKVQGKTVKMKCRKCGATIVVGGSQHSGDVTQDDASVAAAADAGDPGQDLPAGSYLVNVNDGDQRTMTLAEVIGAYQSGVVNAETYVWADGMADWQPLSENDAINNALGGGTNGHATPSPAASVAPVSEPPRARESSRPAARRDAGRRGGDLFSGGMSDGAGLSASVSSQAGKRDENSVLFSLSSLTSAAAPPTPTRSTTTATKEDSGLIDLKALAAAGPSSPTAAAPPVETIGLFPLGAPVLAPPAAAAIAAPLSLAPPQQKSSNMVLIMVMGIALFGAIAVAVFFAVKGSSTQPTATATSQSMAQAQQTTAPAETAAQTAQTTQTAAPTDSASLAAASATASAGAKTAPLQGHPGPGPAPHPGVTPPGPTPTPTPTPTPHPAGAACPCPPGDLMCAMQKCAGKH